MLEYIAQHVNAYTREAFELTVDRIAHRLQVTPQWVGQLRRRLVESGELLVKQSPCRRPNVDIIPYERCPTCQRGNPKLELPVEEIPEDRNPKLSPRQPQSEPQSERPPTPNFPQPNPKVGEASRPLFARISPRKENVKDQRENHVNVEINQPNPKRPSAITLSLREEEFGRGDRHALPR
jgi:hypothetical protein